MAEMEQSYYVVRGGTVFESEDRSAGESHQDFTGPGVRSIPGGDLLDRRARQGAQAHQARGPSCCAGAELERARLRCDRVCDVSCNSSTQVNFGKRLQGELEACRPRKLPLSFTVSWSHQRSSDGQFS